MPNCKTCKHMLHEDADHCPNCLDPDPIIPEDKPDSSDVMAWVIIIGLTIIVPLFFF